MSDCNGAPCRDWIITLARDGSMTTWGWLAIAVLALLLCGTVLVTIWLFDRMT